MNTHDEHYKETEKSGIEPIALMETIMRREGLDAVVSLHIAMAVRYLFRAGTKGDWRSDTEKALNHITKALTGEWVKEGAPLPPRRNRWELMETFVDLAKVGEENGSFFLGERTNRKALETLRAYGFFYLETYSHRNELTFKITSKGIEAWKFWKDVPADNWRDIQAFEKIARNDSWIKTNYNLKCLVEAGLITPGQYLLTQKGRHFWALWSQLPEKW